MTRGAPAILEFGAGDGTRLLVAPALAGRVLTSVFRDGTEAAWLDRRAIAAGYGTPARFHNFGGQDRIWLGPEGGPFGYFFAPGAKCEPDAWRAPRLIDRGSWRLLTRDRLGARMRLEGTIVDASGGRMRVRIVRDVRALGRADVEERLGARLPRSVESAGSESSQVLTRLSAAPLPPRPALPQLWVLGQFPCGPRAVVFAPLRAGARSAVKPFEDRYFGPPGPRRILYTAGDGGPPCVLFRADGRLRSKFGVPVRHSSGIAGAFDPQRELLTIVRFDVHPAAPYGSFLWSPRARELRGGDVFQSYNSGDGTCFELESVAPASPEAGSKARAHRHATLFLRGNPRVLRNFLRERLRIRLPAR